VIRTRGLSHVELAVRDIAGAIRFYADVFGFEVVRWRDRWALLQSPAGPGSLALEEVDPGEGYHVARFGLDLVDPLDLDAALHLAQANGGTVLERVEHPVGGASAVVTDPFGHRIAL
jgi:catechol 2,3-dioxygenase-like lactoylglutathione lyase family enzyme